MASISKFYVLAQRMPW